MPRIPVYGRQQSVNPEPQFQPLTSNRNAIDSVRAIGEIGDRVANLGSKVDDITVMRSKAEARDFAFTQFNKDAEDLQKAEQDSKAQGLDGHTERMRKAVTDLTAAGVKNAPSDTAAEEYIKDTNRLHQNSILEADNYSYFEKAKYNRFKYDAAADDYANRAASDPKYDPMRKTFSNYELQADEYSKSIDQDGGAFSPAEKEKAKADIKNGMLVGHYQGMEVQEKWAEMKDMLNSDTRVSTDLKPEVKAVLLKRAEAGLQQVGQRQAIQLKNTANDLIYSNSNGQMDIAKTQATIYNLKNNKYLNKDDKEDADRTIDNLNTSIAVGADISKAKKLPESDWTKLPTLQKDTNTFNSASRARIKNETIQALSAIRTQREKDPAQAVAESNPAIKELQKQALANPEAQQNYIDTSLAEQKRLGVPPDKQRVTTQSETEFLAMGINKSIDMENPAFMSNEVDKITKQYGPNTSKVFQEMVQDKHVDKGFFIAAQVETPAARSAIISNLKNSKQINESYKTQIGEDNQLQEAVRLSTGPYVKTLNGADGADLKFGDGFQDQVLLEAKNIQLRRSDLSAQDAVSYAKKKIIDDNYDLVSGGRSMVVKAKSIREIDNSTLKSFLVQSASKDQLAKFNPVIPDAAMQFGDQGKDIYLNKLQRSARWIMSPDNKSLTLVQDNDLGGIVPVDTMDRGQRKPIQIEVDQIKDADFGITKAKQTAMAEKNARKR